MRPTPVHVGIDTGGTFTDLIAVGDDGVRTHKVLSTPDDPARAVLQGVRELLADRVADVITYGTTVATNALLERRGAHVVLLTTAGFEDVLEIGRQNRPALYALEPQRVEPLVGRADRIGVAERLDHNGVALVPLTRRELRRVASLLRRRKPDAVAVCLLHAYVDGGHERWLGELADELGIPCTLSHELVGEHREYERTSTTVINAYVAPVMRAHLGQLRDALPAGELRVMQSNGGAIGADLAAREAVRTALSGPAAGVIGARHAAADLGVERLITFDMGGTSSDVSLLDGGPGFRTDWRIGDLPVKVPAIDIHTVGAGGGSIAYLDPGGALKVGPRSAGADPGPACYGRGTAPTVTDANVIAGRLVVDSFLGGRMPLDRERAATAVAQLGRGTGLSVEAAAAGILRVVNASMERAIRTISVERGHDPREYALVAFGGAAGQHACELAEGLSIRRVIVPTNPGLLSACGCVGADTQRDRVVSVRQVDPPLSRLRRTIAGLRREAARGLRDAEISFVEVADIRYVGQSHEVPVAFGDDLVSRFHAEHARLFGYSEPKRSVEIVNLRVTGHVAGASRLREAASPSPTRSPRTRTQRVLVAGEWLEAPIHARSDRPPRAGIVGPALICEFSATTFVPPSWRARVRNGGHLEIVRED